MNRDVRRTEDGVHAVPRSVGLVVLDVLANGMQGGPTAMHLRS